MEIVKFGNWSVSHFGIEWRGPNEVRYNLPLTSLIETGIQNRSILYQWLIEMAYDKRLSAEDIYSLNTAFFYSLDMFRSELDVPGYVLMAETLKAQQEILESRRFVTGNGRG